MTIASSGAFAIFDAPSYKMFNKASDLLLRKTLFLDGMLMLLLKKDYERSNQREQLRLNIGATTLLSPEEP